MTVNWKFALTLAAAGVVAAVASTGATTYALYTASAPLSGAQVVSGALNVDLVGTPTMTRNGTAVAANAAISHGEAFTLTQKMKATLTGANLTGTMNVSWGTAPTLASGVTGTWSLVNPQGVKVVNAKAIGTAGSVANVPVSPGEDWNLVFTLAYGAGTPTWVASPGASVPALVSLGTVNVALTQNGR